MTPVAIPGLPPSLDLAQIGIGIAVMLFTNWLRTKQMLPKAPAGPDKAPDAVPALPPLLPVDTGHPFFDSVRAVIRQELAKVLAQQSAQPPLTRFDPATGQPVTHP